MTKVRVDVTDYEYLNAETGEVARDKALCLYRCGHWCVLRDTVPRDRPVSYGPPCWEPDLPFSVTHIETGRRAKTEGELWRAMVVAEELERVFGERDPTQMHRAQGEPLMQEAFAAAMARIAAAVRRFGFAQLTIEPMDEIEELVAETMKRRAEC